MEMTRRHTIVGGVALVGSHTVGHAQTGSGRLQAWAMKTGALPGFPPDYPADHTAVVGVTTTKQWGCFGRTAAEGGLENRMLVEANGDELWAIEIAGPDGSAGLELDVTGACQQCSNRILLPAGIDVDKARGNEIATPLFGKYGFGIPALVKRIKDGALAVNKTHPRRISERQIVAAVKHVQVNNTDEWKVVEKYLEQMFKPHLGAAWPGCEVDLSHVYQALYNYREALFSQYSKGRITKADFVGRLQAALTGAVQLVTEIVSPVAIPAFTGAPAAAIAGVVFNNK